MAAFEFVAIDLEGRQSRGHIPADTAEQARRELRLRQLIPVEVKPVSGTGSRPLLARRERVSARARVEAVRQLAAIISAGIPVEQSLAIVADHASPKVAKGLLSIRRSISEGSRLAQALEAAPGLFPPVVRSVIAAGDASGRLGEVMTRLAVQMERAQALSQKMRAAAFYPVIVAVFSALLITALMVVIVPRLSAQFDAFGAELPALTRGLMAVSGFLQSYGILLLGALVLASLLARFSLRSESLRQRADAFMLRLPYAGRMIKAAQASLFARILSVLLAAGMPMIEALKVASVTLSNHSLKADADRIALDAAKGVTIAKAFAASTVLPPLLTQMIVSGEVGRNLPVMLDRASDYLESDFESRAAVLVALIEPAIILILGAVVAVVVLAIMLPIIQINTYAIN